MTTVKVTITIPKMVLDKIDNIRGLVPRSTYITNSLVKNLKRN